MTAQNDGQTRKNRTALIVIGALVLAAAAVFVTFQLLSTAADNSGADGHASAGDQTTTTPDSGGDQSKEDDVTQSPTPTPAPGGGFLPEKMNGQEAIDALGDNIDAVAKKNGKTTEELKDLLLRNKTAFVTPSGHLVYLDNAKP
ncbi:hypothetical protein [Leucobacter luti]|uniref:hypothetical protein n=1 Tax=Leucobacter luti TaxID=340320 RepID=UPI003D06259D